MSKRVHDGLDTAVKNGTYCGGNLIMGYKLVDTERAGRRSKFIHKVGIDEEQAEIVRFIFTEYARGTDKKVIADMLNAQGKKYKGKPFHFRTFENWLSCTKYTGEFYLGERFVDNVYPQIIDRLLFEQVQERLKRNRIFAGANKAPVTYLLTGKAFCGHCGTAIGADNGTARNGLSVHYYTCKRKKKSKGLCVKKRNHKDNLEIAVTEFVIRCLKDPVKVDKAADDTIRYYERRTGDDGLRGIETRIANTQKQIDDYTSAFVEARNATLRANIEKKMNELEIYLQDLNAQKAKIRLERGLQITKAQILEFVAELIKGDPNDKEHQKKIIDKLVYKVYISNGSFFVLVNFFDMNKTEHIEFDDIDDAQSGALCGSFSLVNGAAEGT